MSLWLRDWPYLKVLWQSWLVIPNLWGPLQVTLKHKKLSWCKTRDCSSLIKTGASINKSFYSLTTITSNTTSSWVQTCFPRLYSSQTTQKEDCNGLITHSHFVHLEVWNSTEFDAIDDMFHIEVKVKLFGEDWLQSFATEILDAKYEKKDVAEVMKGVTPLNAHQKADLPWVLQENKKCLMKLLTFIHIKRYTLTLIQMPSMCILCLIQYLESIWRLSKRKTTEYTGSATHVNWTESWDISNIRCGQSRMFCASILGTIFH